MNKGKITIARHLLSGLIRIIPALLAGWLLTIPSMAEEHTVRVETWYKAEIIIFEHLDSITDESFTKPLGLDRGSSRHILVDFAPLTPGQTRILNKEYNTLNAQATKLKRSARYRLISHHAWLTRLPDNINKVFQIPTVTDTDRRLELAGFIRVRKARYLHVKPDLLLTAWTEPSPTVLDTVFDEFSLPTDLPPTTTDFAVPDDPDGLETQSGAIDSASDIPLPTRPEFDPIATGDQIHPLEGTGLVPGEFYKLNQPRRMRSNELHYFDHPAFGMLVKIVPVEIEINDSADKNQTDNPDSD